MGVEEHVLMQQDGGDQSFWHQARWALVEDIVIANAATSVLDFGAGLGGLGTWFERDDVPRGYSFIEPAPRLRQELRVRFGENADLTGVSGTGLFDVVVALDVLEHVEDPQLELANIKAHLRPGGIFVMTVPGMNVLWSEWDEKLGHYRRYNRSMVFDSLDAAGLRVEEVSYLFPEMVVPGLVRKVMARRDVSNKSVEFPVFPSGVNSLLLKSARFSQRFRRKVPFGSSVFAVARKVSL
jgi:SAM-dependent methyltransferase